MQHSEPRQLRVNHLLASMEVGNWNPASRVTLAAPIAHFNSLWQPLAPFNALPVLGEEYKLRIFPK